MKQTANVFVTFTIYSDDEESNDPKLRDINYRREFNNIATDNSFSRRFNIAPSDSLTVVQTARSLTQDATTAYIVELVEDNTWRFRHDSGTAPGFRTDRATTEDATTEITVTKSGDVVRYDHTSGTAPTFTASGVIVGDIITIERDGPFNTLNEGVFTVVTVGSDFVEVINASGVAEGPIVLGAPIGGTLPVIDVYSAAGVQLQDQVRIAATAFNIQNRGTFNVTAVTPLYFEFENTDGVPEGPTVIGAAAGIVFFPDIFKWIYLEAEQTIIVRLNGDTGDSNEIEPIKDGDRNLPGVMLKRGSVWQLELVNNGLQTAPVKVALGE
jgi:hypothetical protein